MKFKHWVFLGFAAVGVLYIIHISMQHGGFSISGITSGLGFDKGAS